MAYFKPYFRDFEPLVLNGPLMRAWIDRQGAAILGLAQAGTKKVTGRNASGMQLRTRTFAGPYGDRAVAEIHNMNVYGLQRELGGQYNSRPERAMLRAMQSVSGGRAVATPKIVHGGPRRRSSSKPFLNASKYGMR